MKIKDHKKLNEELVTFWYEKVTATKGEKIGIQFKLMCRELLRRTWGEAVVEHIWEIMNIEKNSDRYVKICTYPHTVDTWAATSWGLRRIGMFDLVLLLQEGTNKPDKVRCPVCGKFMVHKDHAYFSVQGIESFAHTCRNSNKAYRNFRYVPNAGWQEVGSRKNIEVSKFNKNEKVMVESILQNFRRAAQKEGECLFDKRFSEAIEYTDEANSACNALYDFLNMKEYKYEH